MENLQELKIIAHIKNDFTEKFGIPRQSGLVEEFSSTIIFEPKYRNIEAFRGIEGYSHIWLIWQFSKSIRNGWSSTVRPPKLGGNTRMGVFATRSPFRPNSMGLSCVKLEKVEVTKEYGPVLHILGADLMNDTPIFDIKPYLAYTDSHPEAVCGFSLQEKGGLLNVDFPKRLFKLIPENKQNALIGILSQDPRPAYQNVPDRIYKMSFGGFEIHFSVSDNNLTVCNVIKSNIN